MPRLTFYPRPVVFLVLTCCLAWSTALADPPAVYLPERNAIDPTTPDPGLTVTTTTTTTTTTLPAIPQCPASVDGGTAVSNFGHNYWTFEANNLCSLSVDVPGDLSKLYCFENPSLNQQLPNPSSQPVTVTLQSLWETDGVYMGGFYMGPSRNYLQVWTEMWQDFTSALGAAAQQHTEDCFICTCVREIGCFAPGVKITMADGSLRKIEDVRAGDMVRNAKTGAPVKVAKVIEGPEALPLIRFGFDGATVTTSQAHPVLTAAGLKPANQLKKGDTVFDAQGNAHPVTILETLPIEEGQKVINVDLGAASSDENERLLISDGIITGDIVLQGLLKERK